MTATVPAPPAQASRRPRPDPAAHGAGRTAVLLAALAAAGLLPACAVHEGARRAEPAAHTAAAADEDLPCRAWRIVCR